MLEGLQPPGTLYCKEHAEQTRELAAKEFERKIPLILHKKFVDDLLLSPELAFHTFKQNKLKKELRGLLKH